MSWMDSTEKSRLRSGMRPVIAEAAELAADMIVFSTASPPGMQAIAPVTNLVIAVAPAITAAAICSIRNEVEIAARNEDGSAKLVMSTSAYVLKASGSQGKPTTL